MAYTGTPATVPRDAVRLLIWDISTSTSGEFLSNAEVDWFISVSPNVYAAACLAANVLGARVTSLSASTSSVEQKQVGDLMLRYGVAGANVEGFQRAYQSLCARLEKQSALVSAGPFAGGLTVSGKQALRADSDRVKPWAARELFDNPASVEPRASTQDSEII